MPGSPQVGAPQSTPVKPSKIEGLFSHFVPQHLTMLQAAVTADAEQQAQQQESTLDRVFQHVDTLINAMWFG